VNWARTKIDIDGEPVDAIAPVVISASRATDIPAFYTPWLLGCIERGWCTSVNPFNGSTQFVSLERARVFVFWTKNPLPLIPHLHLLDEKGIGYYFLFSVNDYDHENFERNVPPLHQRIETFQRLSETIGKEKVVWRFDPLLLSRDITKERLLQKVAGVGEKLHGYTNKLVISFIDIEKYAKVQRNIASNNAGIRELSRDEKRWTAAGLQNLCREWRRDNDLFTIAACAQDMDLTPWEIAPNRCIDPRLINTLFGTDPLVRDILQPDLFGTIDAAKLKDKGQRKRCGCMPGKDIGRYDTCPHLCTYCYANSSEKRVIENHGKHRTGGGSLLPVQTH